MKLSYYNKKKKNHYGLSSVFFDSDKLWDFLEKMQRFFTISIRYDFTVDLSWIVTEMSCSPLPSVAS